MYDGYHFHQDAVGVYNPFSLLYALSDREFGAWWFETERYVYIIEFKRDSSAEEALCQIEEMGYAIPYAADSRTIIRIGANFDSESRTLNDWKTA